MSNPLHPSRDALLTIARKLPPAAQILAGVCELLHDVNTDLDEIANQIRMDAALASRVIRVSNSVVYGGAGSVASVEEAVGRVGFSEIVRLVGTATINRIADRELRCYHVGVNQLRESLLMQGLASELLALHVGLNRNGSYVAGLLRGLGAMVLDRFAGEQLSANLTYDPVDFSTYDAWETARFGLTGTAVTTMALDDWHFPEDTVTAIEQHLVPVVEPQDEAERLGNVLNLAGAIAVHHGCALDGDVPHWIRTPEKLAAIGIDEHTFVRIAGEAEALFDQQRQALY